MRIAWALLAAVTLPTSGEAQSQVDSAAVILVAWDRLVGSAPFAHPEGRTRLACLTSGPSGSRPHFGDLPSDVQEEFSRILVEDRSVELTTGCTTRLPNTQELGPMSDAEGRPAIDVQLILFEAAPPDRFEVGMLVAAGPLWGRGTHCALERRPDATWRVEDCRVIVHR
jgi:hypothetical protein